MLKIKRIALESALQGARETHPDEFIALFRGEKENGEMVLTELILAPFSSYDKSSSSYSPYFIPANSSEAASFHSHPSPHSAYPSTQDLHFFSRSQEFHFIACFPYRIEDANAFDSKGTKIEFQVIE